MLKQVRSTIGSCLAIIALTTLSNIASAEGSKQLMADTSSRSALCTRNDLFAWNNTTTDVDGRLNIHIANPATEKVYFGFSGGYSTGTSQILGEGSAFTQFYYFRVKNPAGTVVFGPQAIEYIAPGQPGFPAANTIPEGIPGYNQVKAGPSALGISGGYSGWSYTPAPGAPAGDYYVEFCKDINFNSNSQCSFDYWDITVANGTNAASIKDGRVWSKRWGFYSKDYIGAGLYSASFKGNFHTYTPEGFVEKIEFANSGFRGGGFIFGVNENGPGTSGDYTANRRSLYNQDIVGTGFKVFVNNPDIAIYPTGSSALPTFTINNVPVSCNATTINIPYSISRAGVVRFLLDFNNNNLFDINGRDRILVQPSIAGANSIAWDRKDGLGNIVTDADLKTLQIYTQFQLGQHHISFQDIEKMTNGFTVTQVRPIFQAGNEDKFYWDDINIYNAPSGLNVPYVNGPQPAVVELNGAPVRKWDNFVDDATIGFGNKNSISTWWDLYDIEYVRNFDVQCYSISGHVYVDANGNVNNKVDGTLFNAATYGTVPVYAVAYNNTTGKVENFMAVTTNGGFSFDNISNANYSIYITTIAPAIGTTATLLVAMPGGWENTGEKNCGTTSGCSGNDGTNNGILPLGLVTGAITEANFGIERLPESVDLTTTISQPAVNSFLTLNGGANPPILRGSDPEDMPTQNVLSNKNVNITSLPTNGELYYNNVKIAVGADGINPPSITNPFSITSFNASLLAVKFTGYGYKQTSFNYAYVDAANLPDPTPAVYTLKWGIPLPLKILSFVGQAENCDANLEWTTAQEQNLELFEVQYSSDAVNFNTIGKITPHNGFDKNSYEFTYPQPSEVGYYRIKILELNGSVSFTTMLNIRTSCSTSISMSPNPVQHTLFVNGVIAGDQVTIVNLLGQHSSYRMDSATTGKIDFSHFTNGLYKVSIWRNGVQVFSGTILKN